MEAGDTEVCEDQRVTAVRWAGVAPHPGIGGRVAEALATWFGPSVDSTEGAWAADAVDVPHAAVTVVSETVDVDALVARMFTEQGHALVRLARLFVDDRNAAEDLVQEAFIRLARHAHRLEDVERAPAYLRSIVLNLVRDHNRRGLMSLRHHEPADVVASTLEDELILRDDQRRVIEALQHLPSRQRDCVVLRYHFEAGIPEIAETLGISPNSVKTHLKRGLAALEKLLEEEP
jgi:RNA polymerase sigma factor (sigma-70 family)